MVHYLLFVYVLDNTIQYAFSSNPIFQVELENWVNSIHSACAAAFARHRGKTGTLHLLQEEIFRLDKAIETVRFLQSQSIYSTYTKRRTSLSFRLCEMFLFGDRIRPSFVRPEIKLDLMNHMKQENNFFSLCALFAWKLNFASGPIQHCFLLGKVIFWPYFLWLYSGYLYVSSYV